MLSLFCVLLCVVAQLTNSAVHAAAILQRRIRLNGFIGCNLVVDNKFLTTASESNPSGNLRAVHHSVETETIVLKVTTERPVTNLSKDGSC